MTGCSMVYIAHMMCYAVYYATSLRKMAMPLSVVTHTYIHIALYSPITPAIHESTLHQVALPSDTEESTVKPDMQPP